jgi:hypothetical protein
MTVINGHGVSIEIAKRCSKISSSSAQLNDIFKRCCCTFSTLYNRPPFLAVKYALMGSAVLGLGVDDSKYNIKCDLDIDVVIGDDCNLSNFDPTYSPFYMGSEMKNTSEFYECVRKVYDDVMSVIKHTDIKMLTARSDVTRGFVLYTHDRKIDIFPKMLTTQYLTTHVISMSKSIDGKRFLKKHVFQESNDVHVQRNWKDWNIMDACIVIIKHEVQTGTFPPIDFKYAPRSIHIEGLANQLNAKRPNLKFEEFMKTLHKSILSLLRGNIFLIIDGENIVGFVKRKE